MRINSSILLMVAAMLVCGSGCSSESDPWCKRGPLPVENYKWQLEQPGSMGVATASGPAYFQLDAANKQASGYTGVNQFNTTYAIDGRQLSFDRAAMTRRAAAEPAMNQEIAFDSTLTRTAAWRP